MWLGADYLRVPPVQSLCVGFLPLVMMAGIGAPVEGACIVTVNSYTPLPQSEILLRSYLGKNWRLLMLRGCCQVGAVVSP